MLDLFPDSDGGDIERFRALSEATSEAILLLDDGRIREANEQAVVLFRCDSREDLVGSEFIDVVAPVSKTEVANRLRDGGQGAFDVLVQCSDGTTVPAEMQTRSISATEQVAALRNRREQLQTVEALRASERKFRTLFDSSFQFMGVIDTDGSVTEANQTALEFFQLTREDILGRPIWEVFGPMLDDQGIDLLRAAAEGAAEGTLTRYEAEPVVSGQQTYIDVTLKPVLAEHGFVTHIIVEGRDVTERRRAEDALRQSEERLARAQAIAHIGSWEWDIVAGELFWSDEMHRIYGLSPTDEVTYERYVQLLHPDDRERVEATIRQALDEHSSFDYYHRIVRPDGRVRVVHGEGVVVEDEEGNVRAMSGTGQDVTEQKAAEEALEAANERLRRRNQELQEFTYAASHDLREPLRKISTFAEMLKTDHADRLDEEGTFFLQRLLDAVERMGVLINDLLTYSRITTRGRPFQDVALEDVVSVVWNDVLDAFSDVDARIEIDSLPRLEADPAQMRQLLYQLLHNAVKFRASGDGTCVVHVRGLVDDEKDGRPVCHLEVEDHGIGFAEKYVDRIFQPFQRLHGRSQFSGTGMGLAIARRIVDRHRGRLTARSTPAQGSTFTVTLPVRQDRAVRAKVD